MPDDFKVKAKKGQKIDVLFEGREFEVIVIDPNGIGQEKPTVGLGFRMADKHIGLPVQTLSNWLVVDNHIEYLVLPSGTKYEIFEIKGLDNNDYKVIEAADWIDLVVDVLKKPGKVTKATQNKLLDFLRWFAIKGFYAESYVILKGVYTAQDSRVLSAWMETRTAGKYKRKIYTDFLQSQNVQGFEYANWTNYVYLGLFNRSAKEMKQEWELVEGNRKIARNYIPEILGLEAVAYCENMVVQLFVDNLTQAHDDAISYTRRKFFGGLLNT